MNIIRITYIQYGILWAGNILEYHNSNNNVRIKYMGIYGIVWEYSRNIWEIFGEHILPQYSGHLIFKHHGNIRGISFHCHEDTVGILHGITWCNQPTEQDVRSSLANGDNGIPEIASLLFVKYLVLWNTLFHVERAIGKNARLSRCRCLLGYGMSFTFPQKSMISY